MVGEPLFFAFRDKADSMAIGGYYLAKVGSSSNCIGFCRKVWGFRQIV